MARASRRVALRFAVAALTTALGGPARAETNAARRVFDLTVLRPLGLVQTVVSGAVLVAGLPIAAATGSTDELVEICWTQPVDQTFRRPIGEL